jgi:hypothetical protein
MYKNLAHTCQISVTNKTKVRELVSNNHYELKFEYTHLNEIETLELNSLIGKSKININIILLLFSIFDCHYKKI